jgi:hypothetical protein
MPTAAHHRARVLGTVWAAGAHAALGVLAVLGLLNYTVPTKYAVLQQIAAQGYWAWIHFGCAVLLVGSLRMPRERIEIRSRKSDLPRSAIACGIGFAMMVTWAFFNLLWGLSADRPVSLAGPALAFVVAAGEQLLANAWTRGTHTQGR